MVKTKMTFDRLMEQPWYQSIINLTAHYKKGLQPMHYRYALQKNINISSHYREKMEEFFEGSLQKLYDSHLVEKDCIKSSAGLSNFLKKLVDLKLLTRKKDRYKRYKYYVSPAIFSEFFRTCAVNEMYLYPMDEINNIELLIGAPLIIDKPLHQTICRGCFFGLPTEIDSGSYYTPGETKIIKESILNIYANLEKINNIKSKHRGYGKWQGIVSIFATTFTIPKKND